MKPPGVGGSKRCSVSAVSPDDVAELVEALGHVGAGVPQGLVFGHRRLRSLVGAGAGVAELNLQVAALQFQLDSFPKRGGGRQRDGVEGEGQTSEVNMVAQVPMHQHTTGLLIRPSLMPWQILYSSMPPICVFQAQNTESFD